MLAECRLLPLDSFVHSPLQRLTKYPLLLEVTTTITTAHNPTHLLFHFVGGNDRNSTEQNVTFQPP